MARSKRKHVIKRNRLTAKLKKAKKAGKKKGAAAPATAAV